MLRKDFWRVWGLNSASTVNILSDLGYLPFGASSVEQGKRRSFLSCRSVIRFRGEYLHRVSAIRLFDLLSPGFLSLMLRASVWAGLGEGVEEMTSLSRILLDLCF